MSGFVHHPESAVLMPRVHSSIVSMLEHSCDEWGPQPALVCGEQTLSYTELRACVLGLARWLVQAGAKGQRVATVLPNSLLACIAPYAVAAAGAQHVPLNAQYTGRELAYMLRDSAPALVLVDDALRDKVGPLVQDLAACSMVCSAQILQQLPAWRSELQGARLEALYPPAEAPAILQYTGGSSGFPKGVHLSHRAIATNVSQRESLLPVGRGRERVLCVMPLFHSYAMAMGLFLCGYSGSTLVVCSRPSPRSASLFSRAARRSSPA